MYFEVKHESTVRSWQEFEKSTADLFEKFDYEVKRDVRFKTTRRFQIDFIAFDKKKGIFYRL